MPLPLMKILGGSIAFPWVQPRAYFSAVGLPLVCLIGSTLLWSSTRANEVPIVPGVALVSYLLAFSWLAIRIHRLVLLGPATQVEDTLPQMMKRIGVFMSTLIGVWVSYTLLGLVLATLLFSLLGMNYAPLDASAPTFDPEFQVLLDRASIVASLPAMYLAARMFLMFPHIAVDRHWDPRAAWEHARGNGWRLLAVVLLPRALTFLVESLYHDGAPAVEFALVVVIGAFLKTLTVLALSLSYRELVPAPPPTGPPA